MRGQVVALDALVTTHATVALVNAFEGIPLAALDFYEDLEHHNPASGWAANRAVREPGGGAYGGSSAAGPEEEFGSAKAFRLYRDVRFSPDKSPYKTQSGVVVATASGMGWYVQVSAEGLHDRRRVVRRNARPARPLPPRRRRPESGEELRRIVDGLREAGWP